MGSQGILTFRVADLGSMLAHVCASAMRAVAVSCVHSLLILHAESILPSLQTVGSHEYKLDCVFEPLPDRPVRGRVLVQGLTTQPVEEQVCESCHKSVYYSF
jgi:hypothetical protein